MRAVDESVMWWPKIIYSIADRQTDRHGNKVPMRGRRGRPSHSHAREIID